jgi:hypothetical protein
MRVDQASALAWVAVAIAYWCIPSIKGMSGGEIEMQGFHNRKIQQPHTGVENRPYSRTLGLQLLSGTRQVRTH